jgi:hypothetical protein
MKFQNRITQMNRRNKAQTCGYFLNNRTSMESHDLDDILMIGVFVDSLSSLEDV